MDSVPLSNISATNHEYGTADDVKNLATSGITIQDGNSYRTKRRKISITMSTTSHILIAGFTVYILYLSFSKYSLFSWHPSLMTVGALLLMAEAVMAMSQDNILSSKLARQAKVRMHWILQASAAGFIFSGFLIIVINKNIHTKLHFQTLHSILGLITVILVGITSSGGVATLYSVRLKQFIRPCQMKLMHNILGIVTFIVGVVCLIVGLYSEWFLRSTNESYSAQVICTVIIAMAGVLTLESAVKSAYTRFKANFQSS